MLDYEIIRTIEDICKEYCPTERIAEHCASAVYNELEGRGVLIVEEEEN